MSGLAEFQAGFHHGLRGGALPAGLTARDPSEAERRFNVYRNNIVVSLTEALATRFPVIKRLVGDDFFRQMARLHLEQERPETPVLWRWGRGFPDFLERFAPLYAYPYMADVARIEYQRGVSFHAADGEPVSPDVFLNADPSTLVVRLHPSLAILRLGHPAVSIWAANQPGCDQGLTSSMPEIALILRDRGFDVPVRAISTGDAGMIEALGRGAPLLEAAHAALAEDPSHDASRLLRDLMAAGMLTKAEG